MPPRGPIRTHAKEELWSWKCLQGPRKRLISGRKRASVSRRENGDVEVYISEEAVIQQLSIICGSSAAYLRRSVLINNLLRKIHHEEEELEEEEEEEEEEVEEQEEEEEDEEVIGERRLFYPDRKRVKVLVMDCCSPAFGLEELQKYKLVPFYPSSGCLYSLGA
ncbi:hypothetical protein F7725_008693, partial [Dissostichus mawsoni]